MKKIFYILGIFTISLVVSCNKQEIYDNANHDHGFKLKLAGESYDAMTKVSIGEKDGNTYPLLWQAGDIISIWSSNLSQSDFPTTDEDGNVIPGKEGAIFGDQAELFVESAGRVRGVFQTINNIVVTEPTSVVITYPGTATFLDGKVTSTVGTEQVQRNETPSHHVGNNALAYAKTIVNTNPTDAAEFALKQQTAFVKLVLTTSEYSNYKLKGAKLIATGEVLSGVMTTNVEDDSFMVENPKDYVGAQLRTPVAFSGTQEIYFTAIPADLTGKKVIVSVEMTDDEGLKTVTIPANIDGGRLSASCLSVITLNVSSSNLSNYQWYEPVETRALLDAWAYGSQNTYYVEQQKDAPTTITIDVKARGDFSKVVEPKKYGLYMGSSEMSGRKLCYIKDPDNFTYESGTFPVNSDYTIDVSIFAEDTGNGRWSVVALYDEHDNIIWSYMICKYLAEDPVTSVNYPNGVALMDRNLGATYSNKLSATKGTFDSGGAFFQWGRKDPTMWSNGNHADFNPALNTRYLQRIAVETDDISTSIANPGLTIAYGNPNISQGDWKCDEHSPALWGGDAESGIGYKTIYDPCPKGYRVADQATLEYVNKNCERWEMANGHANQTDDLIKADSPFAGNFSCLAVKIGDSYDYWPYAGARWGDGPSWGNRPASNNRHAALYWSNTTVAQQGFALQYSYFSAAFENKTGGANKSRAFTVRCQVDTENR